MARKVVNKLAAPSDLAELLGGGGAVPPAGDCDVGVVVVEGGVAVGDGVEAVGAELLPPVTLTASFWPKEQWLGKLQKK